jgi:hypothetical protein
MTAELYQHISTPFLISGPSVWQEVHMGQTSLSIAYSLVYNTEKEGLLNIATDRFKLIQCSFPSEISREWWAVDLINHHNIASLTLSKAKPYLKRYLKTKQLDYYKLQILSNKYGTEKTKEFIQSCIYDVLN